MEKMPVTRWERAAMAVVLGVMMGWLALLDTGLAHRRGVGVTVLSVAIVAAYIAAAWWWLGNWERWA